MTETQKEQFFLQLLSTDIFQAQVVLEEDTHNALLKSLLNIDLSKEAVQLEYARLRGSLEVLKMLKSNRERLAASARSRNQHS